MFNSSTSNKENKQKNDKNETNELYDKGVKPVVEGTKNVIGGAAEYTAGKIKGQENKEAEGQHDIERGVKHFKNIGSSQEVKDERNMTEKMDEKHKGKTWYDKGVRPIVEGTKETIQGVAQYITGKTKDDDKKVEQAKDHIEQGKKEFNKVGANKSDN